MDKLQPKTWERTESVTNLPAEDSSGMPDAARVNLDALATMANLPARFQRFAAGIEAERAADFEQRREEKRKQNDDLENLAADFARERQREIDENRVKLTIGGEDVDISQGDLRRIMEKRAKELREQREEMARNGANARDLERMDDLIDHYDPLIDELKNGKADRVTMEAIEELAKRDPALEAKIKEFDAPAIEAELSRSTSYAATSSPEGGMNGASLKDAFNRGASPVTPPERAPENPKPVVSAAKNALDSMGL